MDNKAFWGKVKTSLFRKGKFTNNNFASRKKISFNWP